MEKTPARNTSLVEACENCRYSRMTKAGDGVLITTCNFNPPIVSQALIAAPTGPQWMANSQLPIVPKECWCGKYERNIPGQRN